MAIKRNKVVVKNGENQVESDNDKKDNIVKKQRDLLRKLKLDSHRKIERKIFATGASILLMGAGLTLSVIHMNEYKIEQSRKLTGYSSEVQFSKTGTKMNLMRPIYINKGHTYILPVKFKDMSVLSTDANDYRVFISGVKEALGYKPSGQFMLFGSTGYGAVVVQSATGFTDQPVRIAIKNVKNLQTQNVKDDMKLDTNDNAVDAAKKRFDILLFQQNLGAIDIKENKALTNDSNASQYYTEIVGNKQVSDIQKQIKDARTKIVTLLNRAQEFRTRLERDGYTVPDNPAWFDEKYVPVSSPKVNLEGALESGLIASSDIEKSIKESRNSSEETQQSIGQSEKTEYAQYLTRPDGTSTMDDNEVAKVSAGDWAELTSIWTQILSVKQDIYIKKATELMNVQLSVNQQEMQSTIGKSKYFIINGPVKIDTAK
jgi:hypothetical protein